MGTDASSSAASERPSKPATKPPTKSMMNGGHGATTTPGGSPSVGERAQEMRGTLKVRQDAEALLAEASHLRQRAVADADAMVAEAETVAGELVYEARNSAQQIVAEAQERAEGIVARARLEAEEMRAEVDAERDRLRAAVTEAVRADVERAHGGLDRVTPALEEAIEAVAGALGALEVLRGEDWTPRLALERVGPQTVAAEPDPATGDPATAAEQITALPDPDAPMGPADGVDGDARPLGWLFRSNQA